MQPYSRIIGSHIYIDRLSELISNPDNAARKIRAHKIIFRTNPYDGGRIISIGLIQSSANMNFLSKNRYISTPSWYQPKLRLPFHPAEE